MQELIINENNIKDKIHTIRNQQVMLDRNLAELYGVETKRINEAVRNNQDKFMDDFYFELTNNEFENLRSKISTANHPVLSDPVQRYNHPEIFQDYSLQLH